MSKEALPFVNIVIMGYMFMFTMFLGDTGASDIRMNQWYFLLRDNPASSSLACYHGDSPCQLLNLLNNAYTLCHPSIRWSNPLS